MNEELNLDVCVFIYSILNFLKATVQVLYALKGIKKFSVHVHNCKALYILVPRYVAVDYLRRYGCKYLEISINIEALSKVNKYVIETRVPQYI
jgi:hypothetical protein